MIHCGMRNSCESEAASFQVGSGGIYLFCSVDNSCPLLQLYSVSVLVYLKAIKRR